MTALSDSTSARASPSETSSPSATFHSMIFPTSMLSESFGIATSYMAFSGGTPGKPGGERWLKRGAYR